MRNEDMPLFDLAMTPSYLVVAGGGGNEAYGKVNGITVIAKSDAASDKKGDFYKTEDLIKGLLVYIKDAECTNFGVDENSYEEAMLGEKYSMNAKVENMNVGAWNGAKGRNGAQNAGSAAASDKPADGIKVEGENIKIKNTEEALDKRDAKVKGSVHSIYKEAVRNTLGGRREAFYIAAIGDKNFYILKYADGFELLKRAECQAKQAFFTRHLLILHNHTIYGFYNVLASHVPLRLWPKQMHLDDTNEEYFYKLFRKNNLVIYKRECGSADIPDDWDNFFVWESRIYKVIYQDGLSTFVFNNKKYSYEGRIPRIVFTGSMLIFYVLQEKSSLLYFIIKDVEKVFLLPKITCMFVSGGDTIVATCTGEAIVYVNGEFYSKTQVTSLPITGIALENRTAFCSTIDGMVMRFSVRRFRYSYGILLALLVAIVGLLVALYKK